MRQTTQLIEIAQNAVKIGYNLIKKAAPHEIHQKGDRDFVTEVDLKIEREISAYLEEATPEIGFLGEEEGERPFAGPDRLTWTLDPIDGTSNFVHGLPLCATSLALVRDGTPIVAAISAPFLDLQYAAAEGLGSFVNGKRLRASTTDDLSKAIVSIGDYAVGKDAAAKNAKRLKLTTLLADNVERVRMFGTAALDLVWVAEGRIDATVILANKPWDTAAGVLIAREAGALVIDSTGSPHTHKSAETIATSPRLASDLLPLIQTSLTFSPSR
ncbi:inositol monophosphatase family protein [Kutzneria chonburiensis]|uniref:Inositol-1-monophosphatase n=1 Tax=Kutzneria chonburiensis TaxID=1483604 RepID=A0ABV6N550_9PSEU|nr:inositol monophosphatase family protein [Kutzneria chonburiensis]